MVLVLHSPPFGGCTCIIINQSHELGVRYCNGRLPGAKSVFPSPHHTCPTLICSLGQTIE